MRDLTFVGVSGDGASMIFKDANGTEFLVPTDERMSLALKIDRENPPAAVEELSPREIQQRIRAGASAEDVAAESGMPLEKVERYAGPPLAERAFMSERARSVLLRRSDGTASLEDVVLFHLAARGVDTESVLWDAFRRNDNLWTIIAAYHGASGPVIATWTYDNGGRTVVPVDPEGAILMGAQPDSSPTIITERPALASVPDLVEPAPVVVIEETVVEETVIIATTNAEVTEIEPAPEPVVEEPVVAELELGLPAAEKPKPKGKKGRTSVPSWDEILFGAPE